VEEKFRKIAEEAMEKAERVKCSLGVFATGLSEMVDMFKDRLEMVEDELGDEE